MESKSDLKIKDCEHFCTSLKFGELFSTTGEVVSCDEKNRGRHHPKNGLFDERGRDVDQRRIHRGRVSSKL